jgi:hypothetical protein
MLTQARTNGVSKKPLHETVTEPDALADESVAGAIDPKLMLDIDAVQTCARTGVASKNSSAKNSAMRLMATTPCT